MPNDTPCATPESDPTPEEKPAFIGVDHASLEEVQKQRAAVQEDLRYEHVARERITWDGSTGSMHGALKLRNGVELTISLPLISGSYEMLRARITDNLYNQLEERLEFYAAEKAWQEEIFGQEKSAEAPAVTPITPVQAPLVLGHKSRYQFLRAQVPKSVGEDLAKWASIYGEQYKSEPAIRNRYEVARSFTVEPDYVKGYLDISIKVLDAKAYTALWLLLQAHGWDIAEHEPDNPVADVYYWAKKDDQRPPVASVLLRVDGAYFHSYAFREGFPSGDIVITECGKAPEPYVNIFVHAIDQKAWSNLYAWLEHKGWDDPAVWSPVVNGAEPQWDIAADGADDA